MPQHLRRIAFASLVIASLVSLDAATISRQNADEFTRKMVLIQELGAAGERTGTTRTPLTEDEVNSWFTYHAQAMMPNGLAQPQLTLMGQGRVAGQAIVDFDVIARQRASGSTLDPWSLIGGKVPVRVTGILHTREGMGRFELQTAEVSGMPVPTTLLQEMVGYYSRTPDHPEGFRLDDTFPLPSNIRLIEVGQARAVVVQ